MMENNPQNTWGKNLASKLSIPLLKLLATSALKDKKMKWLYNTCILKAKKVVLLLAVEWFCRSAFIEKQMKYAPVFIFCHKE